MREIMIELREVISGLELKGTIFRCNHASNPLPLGGRFPRDREKLLDELNQVINQIR